MCVYKVVGLTEQEQGGCCVRSEVRLDQTEAPGGPSHCLSQTMGTFIPPLAPPTPPPVLLAHTDTHTPEPSRDTNVSLSLSLCLS